MHLSTVFNCFYFTLAIYLAAKSFRFEHPFLFLVILALLLLIVYVFIFLRRHGTGDSCLVASPFASDYKGLVLYTSLIGQMAEKYNLLSGRVASQLSSCFLLIPSPSFKCVFKPALFDSIKKYYNLKHVPATIWPFSLNTFPYIHKSYNGSQWDFCH